MNFLRVGPLLVMGLSFGFGLMGCATYQTKVDAARLALADGNYEKALGDLKPLALTPNDDQLVYLLDYGVALQIAGQADESNKVLLRADRLSEEVDYQSVSRIAGSLALNQEMIQYKGDTFEKIFINAYLAMNFLSEGKQDEALVEARRINEKYLKYRADEKKAFELNSFSKYLSALAWEADRRYDDAYIAYAETYKIDPSGEVLHEDLIRSAKLARRPDEYQKWKKKFPEVRENPDWYDDKKGELIILFQQGWGPRKAASGQDHGFPLLVPVHTRTSAARLLIEGQDYFSRKIYDVEAAAIRTLQEDQGLLLAKRLAGIATKAVLADQVRQKDQALGDITYLVLRAMDRADLRQWSTLPESIQLIRVPLKPGKYKFQLDGVYALSESALTGESYGAHEVEIKKGKKTFVVWRSLK